MYFVCPSKRRFDWSFRKKLTSRLCLGEGGIETFLMSPHKQAHMAVCMQKFFHGGGGGGTNLGYGTKEGGGRE